MRRHRAWLVPVLAALSLVAFSAPATVDTRAEEADANASFGPPQLVIVATPPMELAARSYANDRAAALDVVAEVFTLPALIEMRNAMRRARGAEPVDPTDARAVAMELRAELHEIAAAVRMVDEEARFDVLFVGDTNVEGARFDIDAHIPCFYRTCVVDDGVATGNKSEDDVATDNTYAAADGDDDIPAFAVGRLPFTKPEQLTVYARRVQQYETSPPPGAWRRRMSCFAGPVGFEQLGPQIEKLIEDAYARGMAQAAHPAFDVAMTYANIRSPYTYAPSKFSDKIVETINEGALILNYIGHGWMTCVDRLEFRGNSYEIFNARDAANVDTGDRPPIAAFFTCSTGYFDYKDPSLAEALVLNPRGCLGVMASSRVSSQSNYMLEVSFLESVTATPNPTLGSVFLGAKRGIIDKRLPVPPVIKQLGIDFSDEEGYTDNKRTHMLLYNLFGDPTLRLAVPQLDGVTVAAPERVKPGQEMPVEFTITDPALQTGKFVLTLERDRLMFPPNLHDNPIDGEAFEELAIQNHAMVNDRVVDRVEGEIKDGAIAHTFQLADDAKAGRYHAKLLVQRGDDEPITLLAHAMIRVSSR